MYNILKQNNISIILKNLCTYLYKHYHKKVLILIDEYDFSLQNAYTSSFYESAVKLMKSLFSRTFKGNEYIYKTVVTGVSRITKEGIFTGANNFDVYTVLKSSEFSDDFGFTKEEVDNALDYFELGNYKEKVKNYYDGYIIGDTTDIYNPWSILKYLKLKELDTYWANTSRNDIINRVVETVNAEMQLYEVKIPNREIMLIFNKTVSN